MKEARYYIKTGQTLSCRLCPKHCRIKPGETGFCRVRKNIGGTLYAQNYGECTGYALDPIEKKPLYHFYPGSTIFSVGTWGCNFACQFCQNWEIAQAAPQTVSMLPEDIVQAAAGAGRGNIGIAYTYSEPGVWFEYIIDCAGLARSKGLQNVLVTNGFINSEPLRELLPVTDAMNIDVKAFNEEYYRQVCAGALRHVQNTVEVAAEQCHVEITTLIMPGMNDREQELKELAKWLAGLSIDIPLHFSRYFPRYKMSIPPTPVETLRRAYEIASEYLNYVYIGNVSGMDGTNTYCPGCDLLVIDRLRGNSWLTPEKNCPRCGKQIAICGEVAFPFR